MSHLAIFALGPLRIELDGKPLQTSRHKALALLVYLAMCPGKQSRMTLSALFWPEYEQEKAYAYLRRTLWEIHTLLGDGWIEADRDAIGFSPEVRILLDVVEFQTHLEAFHRHAHPASTACPECISHLHTAALLYRGDFLSGFSLRDSAGFEDWQFFQSEALRNDYSGALQKLVSLLRNQNSFDEAAVFAQRWLALDTLNEEAHRELMMIYVLSGQRSHALRQYKECQRLMQTELKVAPEGVTIALYEQILFGNQLWSEENRPEKHGIISQSLTETISQGNWLEEVFSVNEGMPAGALPPHGGPFIGREQELKQIADLLADPACWLLTLLGPGGIGKTRLAVEVGKNHQATFSHGVFLIPLNAVESEASLAPAIARATGLTFRQDSSAPEEQLLDFLREKQALLILDSFETLIRSTELLRKIHQHAKQVKILVTSRHRLPLHSAWILEIKGLDYPQELPANLDEFRSYSAIELFWSAAQRAEVGFRMAETDLPAVTRIAQLLEGMPLGLELAATWLKTLSCQEIAKEISRGLDFLETSLQDLPERQRSIRAVFDYSWNLLNSREQRVFSRLAVFQGRFNRHAAEQIAGISLRELAGLVDKSLVQRSSEGRFVLHDLLHQYCLEILDHTPADSQETRSRHCAFFCTRLSEWNVGLSGDQPGQILRQIEADLENARAAWDWAVSQGQVERLEQACDGLGMFFLRRARFMEGLTIYKRAEETLQALSTIEGRKLRARLLIWQAVYSINLADYQAAGQLMKESGSIIADMEMDSGQVEKERVFLLTIKAEHALLQYNLPACLGYFEQSFQLVRKSGFPFRWAVYFWRYLMSGGTASEKIYRLFKEILPYVRMHSDLFEIGSTLYTLGIIEAFWYYRLDEAEPLLRESVEIYQKLDDPVSQGMIYKTQWFLFLFRGKFIENLALKKRELAIYQDLGDRCMTGIALAELAECAYHLGKYEEAEAHIRTGMDLLKDRVKHEYALRHRYLGDILVAQGKCHEAIESYQFSLHYFQTVGESTWTFNALAGLSRAELALGDRSSAWEHAIQALRLYREGNVLDFFVYQALAVFALLLADKGDIKQALELYGKALSQPNLANSRWFTDLYGKEIEKAASSMICEEQAELKQAGQSMDLSHSLKDFFPMLE
jgi:DNA-binding SARP family transcriptional activator/predicted ATPase